MQFCITIHGALPEGIADRLWRQIEWTKSNLTVLDKNAYIYGDCGETVIDEIVAEAKGTGYPVEVDRR
jgi:hypothetical protein